MTERNFKENTFPDVKPLSAFHTWNERSRGVALLALAFLYVFCIAIYYY